MNVLTPDKDGRDVPVSFTPMTGNIATKAIYKGEQNATYTGKGSDYEEFKAWAKYTDAPGTNPQTGGIAFFDGVTCVHGGTKPNDYWAPDPIYYWPKNGYLSFHAFSPQNLSPFIGTVTHDWNTGFTITGFEAGKKDNNYRNLLVDILYSDFVFKKRRSDFTPETGVPYDEAAEETGYNHKGVNLTFHHALAGVQFRFKTDADYSSGNVKYTFTTTRIEILNMNYKGEFHENRTSNADNTFGNAPSSGAITINNDNSITATPYWIPNESVEFDSIYASMATTDIDSNVKPVGSMMLIMPQNLSHSTGNDVKVKITYTFKYKVGAETEKTYANRTVTIPLNGLTGKIGGTDYTINQWLINHKYTYTIVFHLDPLLFDPYISVDYVDVSGIGIELPYQS